MSYSSLSLPFQYRPWEIIRPTEHCYLRRCWKYNYVELQCINGVWDGARAWAAAATSGQPFAVAQPPSPPLCRSEALSQINE